MLTLALAVPVVFMLGAPKAATKVATPATNVIVEGASPVSLGGKAGKAYFATCTDSLKVTAIGPASLVVDVRGKSANLSKALELDITRNEKSVSKNSVTLKKSKSSGKGFTGLGSIVVTVPDGTQQYAIACDAAEGLALSFRVSKKPVSGTEATAEVATAKPAIADAKDAKSDGKDPKGDAKDDKPPAVAVATGSGDNKAFIGLFTHATAVMGPTHF